MTRRRDGDRPAGDARDDATVFLDAVRDARKLPGPRRVPVTPGVGHGPRPASATARARGPTPATPAPAFTIEQAGETWTARADGVDRRLLRKLRDGQISVEGKVDLHGLARDAATRALDQLFAAARAAGHRCLLVIHGRGLHSGNDGPTLRDTVRERLTTGNIAATILACASAPPPLGGPGATLVWLRRL